MYKAISPRICYEASFGWEKWGGGVEELKKLIFYLDMFWRRSEEINWKMLISDTVGFRKNSVKASMIIIGWGNRCRDEHEGRTLKLMGMYSWDSLLWLIWLWCEFWDSKGVQWMTEECSERQSRWFIELQLKLSDVKIHRQQFWLLSGTTCLIDSSTEMSTDKFDGDNCRFAAGLLFCFTNCHYSTTNETSDKSNFDRC